MSYQEQRRRLVDYLYAKAEIGDWHAVADAAMDLRELEAEKRGSEKTNERRKR